MKLISQFGVGLSSYQEAIRFVQKHRLGKLIALSSALYLLIILISFLLIWLGVQHFFDFILSLPYTQKLPPWLENFSWVITFIKTGIFFASLFLFFSLYKFLFLAIASPLYAYISERTAEIIHQTQYSFNAQQLMHDIIRGVQISFINFLRQLFLTVILYIFSFIPLIGLLFSLTIVILDCYYYGFSMLDYSCEREKLSVRDSRKLIAANKGLAIGNGFLLYLSLLIPFIGIIIIAPLSAVAATLSYYKIKSIEPKK